MGGTLKATYLGWDITIRCLKFRPPASMPGSGDRFTASGHAVLQDTASDGDWIDARIQVLSLHGKIYCTAAACAEVLLAEMRVLLDALRRLPPLPG